jgi:hypothetical protein
MKKVIVLSLLAVFALSINAFALVSADYFRINTGAKSGAFNRTLTPVHNAVVITDNRTKATSSEVSAGEVIISMIPSTTTGEAKIYLIAKDRYGNAVYRTIGLGTATIDAFVVQ